MFYSRNDVSYHIVFCYNNLVIQWENIFFVKKITLKTMFTSGKYNFA